MSLATSPFFLPSRRTRDYNDYLTREPVSWDGRERREEGKRKFVKRVFRSWKDFIFGENLSQKDIYLLFWFFIRSFFFFFWNNRKWRIFIYIYYFGFFIRSFFFGIIEDCDGEF